MRIDSTDRITIAGLPGNGKTVLAQWIAANAYPRVLIYDALGQFNGYNTVTLEQMKKSPKSFWREGNRYLPRTDSKEEFDAVCEALRHTPDVMLIAEEVENLLNVRKQPTENAYALMNRGRNWGVGMCVVVRRIEELSKSYFGLCKHVIFFRCGLRSDKYIREMVGDEVTAAIKTLPEFYFVDYHVQDETYTIATLDLPQAARG